jgi:type II secretory pathway pseudopilin PulG
MRIRSTTASSHEASTVRSRWTRGFSLVETTVALGISALSLSLLMGLLPAGMSLTANASRQAEASRLLKQIATGIQAAPRQDGGSYQVLGLQDIGEITWTPGDLSHPPAEGLMDASGSSHVTADKADFAYRIEITPPPDDWTSGRAVIRIAWPATSIWENSAWHNHQGSVRALLIFRPQ